MLHYTNLRMRLHVFMFDGILAGTTDTSAQTYLNRVKGIANTAAQKVLKIQC